VTGIAGTLGLVHAADVHEARVRDKHVGMTTGVTSPQTKFRVLVDGVSVFGADMIVIIMCSGMGRL
jgi:hypothetical protein